MNSYQNICVTVCMVSFCYSLAVIMPNIGSVIAITGATVNPFIGYIFPILFFLKIDPAPMNSRSKVKAQCVLYLCVVVTMLGMAQLTAKPKPEEAATVATIE